MASGTGSSTGLSAAINNEAAKSGMIKFMAKAFIIFFRKVTEFVPFWTTVHSQRTTEHSKQLLLMQKRKEFLQNTVTMAAGGLLFSQMKSIVYPAGVKDIGVQLYTFRKEMLADARGTLQQIADIGIKQIES